MEYLEKMLGVSVKYHRWKGELELPYYINDMKCGLWNLIK